ncbi:MAG TPA: hypothetical protein VGI39_43070 [Polyangiaceae bacterium]
MRPAQVAVVAWLCAAGVAACAACAKEAPSTSGAPSVESKSETKGSAPPAALSKISTTSPEIALGNLDAQIDSRRAMLARNADDAAAAHALVDLLLARGEYASRIADYEDADARAAAFLDAHPASADAHLARASTLGVFHRFDAELAELDAASRLHAPAEAVDSARRAVLMARAQFDEAAALGAGTDPALLDPMGLATLAVLAAERGAPAESDAVFERARAKYRDVSPFPLAWMDFQRGSLLERRGDRARARLYFEEAHAALPGFAHPAVHLAGLVEPAAGLAMLAPLVDQTDDPQVAAAYADALRRVGRGEEAKAPTERARAGYERLVQRHPEAFADHAAQFYLGLGHDPSRALALARRNAENRATEPALDLWMTAALVAGERGEACAAAARGATVRYASSTFQSLVETTRAGCTAVAARAP